MADKEATRRTPTDLPPAGSAASGPDKKAVSGPPENKAYVAPKRKCLCGGDLVPYEGPSAHKAGSFNCASCGARIRD